MIDENLYWHMHAEYVYNSLVKYFGIFNHVKTIISKKIARQLYFAFIHSRIKYGIEVFGDCANEYLQKLQVIQNKLLKLLLSFDRRMSTNELHQQLSLLKVVDIHTVNVLSFVNECRSGRWVTMFSSYYHVREAGYELRHNDRLHVPMAIGCFKIQKFLSCIVAFYSPVMHAKGNSHAKFQQNRCAFGPPRRSFSDFGLRGLEKRHIYYR